MGLDAFPHDDPLFAGMIGTYGNRSANLTIANADLLLLLGHGLIPGDRNPTETFARKATFIHVDIDLYELNNKIKGTIAIHADVRAFLASILQHPEISEFRQKHPPGWQRSIITDKVTLILKTVKPEIDPNYFMHVLSEKPWMI